MPLSPLASLLRPRSDVSDSNASLYSATDYSFGDDQAENGNKKQELPVGEFLARFRDHASESLCNAYETSRPHHISYASGSVTTPLCEDILSLVDLQINTLHDYLETAELLTTETGDAVLLDGLVFLFRNLWFKQRQYRDRFLTDLQASCAAANDFLRLMEGTEALSDQLKERYPHLKWDKETEMHDSPMATLSLKISELLYLFSGDAVFAAQRVHVFVFQTVNRSRIQKDLFGREWEEKLTHNEVALSLVKTIEDYLSDAQSLLANEFLYIKVVHALAKATVCFYVRCLIQKADSIRFRIRNFKSPDGRVPFKSPDRALSRIMYDIEIIQEYFQDLVKELPALDRLVENELSVLVALHECLGIAVGRFNEESLEHFIIVLHKRTGGNVMVTKHLVADLWLLVAPPKERHVIDKTTVAMKTELEMMSKYMKETEQSKQRPYHHQPSGIQLGDMLKELYEERHAQESRLCGQVLGSVNEPSSETRQEVEKEKHKARRNLSDHGRDPPEDDDWLDITASFRRLGSDTLRGKNPLHKVGDFLKEKVQEVLHLVDKHRF